MKANYPKQFGEAEELYEQLNKKYPEKRDLTKTSEFLTATTKHSTFTDLYRHRYKVKKTSQKEKHTPETTEMVLQIPLMAANDITTSSQGDNASMSSNNDEALSIPEDTYNMLTTSSQGDNASMSTNNDEALSIPEDTYNMLVEDLLKDPELRNVFNDMTDSHDTQRHQQDADEIIRQFGLTQAEPDRNGEKSPMTQLYNEFMDEIDAILPELEKQSPLESELEQLGW